MGPGARWRRGDRARRADGHGDAGARQAWSDALRREFLAPAIAGRWSRRSASRRKALVPMSPRSARARCRDGDDYVISGSKMWITNGTQADWICLLANTSDGQPHRNKSLIVVPMKSKGVSVARKLKKLGCMPPDTAQIFFDEVRVPVRNRIGEEGRGFIYQMEQFQEERLYAAARPSRCWRRRSTSPWNTRKGRKAFGKRADRHADDPAQDRRHACRGRGPARHHLERGGNLHRRRRRHAEGVNRQISRGQARPRHPNACLQFWGGQGYMWESRISRIMRDIRLTAIGGGANEIMLQVIAKNMGLSSSGGARRRRRSSELCFSHGMEGPASKSADADFDF